MAAEILRDLLLTVIFVAVPCTAVALISKAMDINVTPGVIVCAVFGAMNALRWRRLR